MTQEPLPQGYRLNALGNPVPIKTYVLSQWLPNPGHCPCYGNATIEVQFAGGRIVRSKAWEWGWHLGQGSIQSWRYA